MQTKACKVSSNGEHNYVPMSTESTPDSKPGEIFFGIKPSNIVQHVAVYCTKCSDTQDLRPATAVWVQNEVETGLPIRLGGRNPRDHGHLNEPAD